LYIRQAKECNEHSQGTDQRSLEELITQERLREVVSYTPETGEFIKNVSGKVAGYIAGSNGYLHIVIDKKCYSLHRLAFLYITGRLPSKQVDHINRDKTDNRWENLRDVSATSNCRNRGITKNNTSGVAGVCWSKTAKSWYVRISTDTGRKCLGYFNSLTKAKEAREIGERVNGYSAR